MLDLGATIRDEEGSSTISGGEPPNAPMPHIDKVQPGALNQQRYAIESLVGRGATSQVFSANDLVFDRRIAIKFLAGSRVEDPKRIGRFMREAKMTAALEHPNIAPIHDLDITGKTSGTGRAVVESILASADGPVRIIDIVPSATGF